MIKATAKPSSLTLTDHTTSIEHERLISLINSMADAVIAVDENNFIAVYNGAALNILDVNIELRGHRLKTLVKLIDINHKPINIETLVNKTDTQFTTRDLLLEYPNHEVINLYLSVAPVHLGFGVDGSKGHVLLLRDITHEKSLEEERDEFISVVSHELRTPIAIAEGNISNAQFIVDKSVDVPIIIKNSLKAAYDQIIYLADMINDLATLSRAERGKLNVEVEAINVHDLVKKLQANYIANAKAKGLNIITNFDPELQLLYSSQLYVNEILQNFITNAIKYTNQGFITISAKAKTGGVQFEVSDTGIGISKTDKHKVFDKFFRSEDYRTRQSSGTGLGLYVTKKLAGLLSAKLEIESELNHGSTFSVFVPNLKP